MIRQGDANIDNVIATAPKSQLTTSKMRLKCSLVERTASLGSRSRGVWPCSLRTLGTAPYSSSNSVCLVFSSMQAKCKGVLPTEPYKRQHVHINIGCKQRGKDSVMFTVQSVITLYDKRVQILSLILTSSFKEALGSAPRRRRADKMVGAGKSTA